ncbi:MAG: glycosyltransferase family 39 protein, partial [Bacteroidota bacterium]
MNILQPRVDGRGQFTGITGMEFPIVSYAIAVGYKLFGFSNVVQRVVMLLFSFVALIGCFLFAKKLFHSQSLGFAAMVFLMFSPLFCYYSIVVLPDLPSLAFAFLSLSFFLSYQESGPSSSPPYLYAVVLLTFLVSVLIKVYALAILPFFVYSIWKRERDESERIFELAAIGFVVVLAGLWYLYARYLSDTYHNYDFRLNANFPYPLDVVLPVLKKVFVQWLPELFINYAEFVFFCVGIFILTRGTVMPVGRFVLLYLSVFALYAIAFLPMFEIHDYYAIPALPMLVVLTTVGFAHLVTRSEFLLWVR